MTILGMPTYHEWDDLEPPIVRVSNDASMGLDFVRTKVRRTQENRTGQKNEESFVYTGTL
jgi:hypothetical protein